MTKKRETKCDAVGYRKINEKKRDQLFTGLNRIGRAKNENVFNFELTFWQVWRDIEEMRLTLYIKRDRSGFGGADWTVERPTGNLGVLMGSF